MAVSGCARAVRSLRISVQQTLPFDLSESIAPEHAAHPVHPEPPEHPRTRAPEFVRHPRARRYVVRVRADGSVRVTIPRWGSKREAVAFAEQQRGWIEKQLARLENERPEPREELSDEETRALRTRAKKELPDRLLQLASALGLRVARVSVRNQQSRWGSCSPNGHICLNWRLVTMPEWVRDYVIIHELMHLKRLDHSKKFWKLVAAACPQYQEARAWLRKYRRG
jgi:predicted metal-dependent hydrolase